MVLAVYSEPYVAHKRRIYSRLTEYLVAEVVLHICGVGVDVVEIELVKPVVGLSLDVFAEIDLEAVAVVVLVGGDR